MSRAMETAIKMLESLPLQVQDVVEELSNLVEEARDEARWDELFERKKVGLVAAALKARGDVAAGKAPAMNYDKL